MREKMRKMNKTSRRMEETGDASATTAREKMKPNWEKRTGGRNGRPTCCEALLPSF